MNAPPPPLPAFAPGSGRPRPPYQPRKLACPNCSDQLEIKDETGRLAVCPSCRSHIEVTQADAKVLQKAGASPSLANIFQLDIGDRFKYQKARYEVIGRLRFDEEESLPTCQYLLYNPRRGKLWLSEYQGHWDISHTSRLMPAGDARGMKKGDELTTYDGAKWLVGGKGMYQLSWVDGALPWVAKIGDQIEYAELVASDGSGETYEVEYPQSGGREMEAGRGRFLTIDQVRQATGKDIFSPTGPRENVHEITLAFKQMKKVALLFVALNIFLIFFFAMAGNRVLDQTFSPDELSGEVMSDPFQIQRSGVLKIDLRAPLDNSWMAIDLALVRDGEVEPMVVHVTDKDIQYYSGREGGESWSEGSKSSRQFLLVPEPGTYRLLVRAVTGQGNANTSDRSHVPLRVKAYFGVKRAIWLFLASLASFVTLIIVFVQHQKWRTADDEDDDEDWDDD